MNLVQHFETRNAQILLSNSECVFDYIKKGEGKQDNRIRTNHIA